MGSPPQGSIHTVDGVFASMNVTYQQQNAAGGAIVCEIVPGSGAAFIVLPGRQTNSGTNSCFVETMTAAGGAIITTHGEIVSGAATQLRWSPGLVSTTPTGTNTDTGFGYPLIVNGLKAFRIRQSGAGALNDTMQIVMGILIIRGGLPTVSHANSTNQANVAITAGAESFSVDS